MRFIVTDTETIGLYPPKAPASGVVQVAWTDIDPDTLQFGEIHSKLVNPEAPIAEEASKVHGKYMEDVADCPPLQDVYKFNQPLVCIGHNIPFDLKFLGRYIDNLAGEFCTLKASRRLWPKAPNHKLVTMVDYLGLEKKDAHDAGGDVHMTAQLLQRIVQEMSPRTLRDLVHIESKPVLLSTVPFGQYKGQTFVDMPIHYLEWVVEAEGMHQDMVYTAKRILTMKGK